MTMRELIYILNEFKMLSANSLRTKDVVCVLASDDENVFDAENTYNLEFEVMHLKWL